MSNSDFAAAQITKIRDRIALAANTSGRNAEDIKLIGASKFQSAELVDCFHQQGLNDVGENYLNEALVKQRALQNILLNWHFIGRIQSNKTNKIASNFNWVHGVASLTVAQRLSRQNPAGKQLNILLQINVDQEDSKNGVSLSQAPELCLKVSELANVSLRGFMVLPKASESFDQQRRPFAATRELLEYCNQSDGLRMDTLSMGMSADLEAAIIEGSTMLRIGTDLFGPRPQKQESIT